MSTTQNSVSSQTSNVEQSDDKMTSILERIDLYDKFFAMLLAILMFVMSATS